MRRQEHGFTLVEVLIMSPIIMVTVVLLMSYLFNQYGQLTKQGAVINLQVEAQNIIFGMQDDLLFAKSFESDKNPNLTDTYQPGSGWSAGTTPPTLIISDLALTTNKRDPNRQPIYINTFGCTPQDVLESNDELYNNTIYFVSGTQLFKRTLTAPSTLALCGAPYQKQTCPSANASPTCPPDKMLTDKLDTFSITYYDTNNATVTSPELAEKIRVSVQLKDKAFAEDIFANASATLRKINL